MQTNRIPSFDDKSAAGLRAWMKKMWNCGMLFHPDDDPATIVYIKDGKPMFNEIECRTLAPVIDEMFKLHGGKVYDEGHRLMWRHLMKVSRRRSSVNRLAKRLH